MGRKILIIGGVAGGAGTAARIRRLDEQAEIIMFERGDYISFANCGLPYYIGERIKERSDLLVMKAELMAARFRVDVRVLHEVTAIDRTNKTITVHDIRKGVVYTESYDKLVLATGSSPFIPPIPGISNNGIFTLWSMADCDHIKTFIEKSRPSSAIVIGGGFIGMEMAENLHGLGIQTTIIEMLPQVMPNIDPDLASILHQNITSHGITLMLGEQLSSCDSIDGQIRANLTSGKCVHGDMMVLAIGVRPNSQLAANANLALNRRGGIIVDSNLRTSDPDIYALGDVIEVNHYVTGEPTMIPLAGPANKQARICADNICGTASQYDGSMGASVAKVFDLTVASVGLNEKQLNALGKQIGIDYYAAVTHAFDHAAYYPDAEKIAIKVLYSNDGTVIGAAAVGKAGVDKRIDVIATAMHFHAKIGDLKDLELCYAPPYSSAKDPVNMIGFIGDNNMRGLCKYITVDQFDRMDKENVIILDVRQPSEVANGAIPGAINIPLNQLRTSLDRLNKSKRIVVYCAIGLRAYLACRILNQHGFDTVDMSGGYTTYSQIHG